VRAMLSAQGGESRAHRGTQRVAALVEHVGDRLELILLRALHAAVLCAVAVRLRREV